MALTTILIIDDSPLVRRKMRDVLEALGFAIVEAGDGGEGLALLERAPVGLVITDFVMPNMSGLELIESIRQRPSGAELPVIVVSTQSTGALVEHGWSLGVKAWLKKPVSTADLSAAVTAILSPAAGAAHAT